MGDNLVPRLRRFIRLSVRSLLLLVLVLAVWLAWMVNRAREQRQAVAAIREYGGFVSYDWEYVNGKHIPGRSPSAPTWLRSALGDEFFQEVVAVNLIVGTRPDGTRGETVRRSDDVILHLRAFPALRQLNIQETQATDRVMEVIGSLKNLEILRMPRAAVTDRGIAKLRGLSRLKNLAVTHTRLTDASISHLKTLTQLEVLDLQGGNVTDRGMAHLRGMTNLKALLLSNDGSFVLQDITDAGMAHLSRLSKLEFLAIQRCKITDAGLESLKGLENLKVLWIIGSLTTPEGLKRFGEQMPALKSIR